MSGSSWRTRQLPTPDQRAALEAADPPLDAAHPPLTEIPEASPAPTPTLSEVRAAGNDAGGGITGVDYISHANGGSVQLTGGSTQVIGKNGASGVAGERSTLRGGSGHAGAGDPAAISADGGGADGTPGRARMFSAGSTGNAGDVPIADGPFAGNTMAWGALVSYVAGAPGSSYVSPLRADTSAKKLYAWNGSAYAQIGAWT